MRWAWLQWAWLNIDSAPSQVAQLKHSVTQKEELLRLYARDAQERDREEAEVHTHTPNFDPDIPCSFHVPYLPLFRLLPDPSPLI